MDSQHNHDAEQPDDTTRLPAAAPEDADTTAYPIGEAPVPPAPTPPASSQVPGTPTPPPAAAPGTVAPSSPFVRSDHRAGRVAAGVVGALVLVIGSGAAGIAIGHATVGGSSQTPTSLGTSAPQFGGGTGGGTGGNGSGDPYGDGGGFSQFGPGFGDQQQGQQGQPAAASSTATASQITGLVRIQTDLGYEDGEGAGTGMILSSDGEVLTNHHVVEGATKITATVMSTHKTYTAQVVGTDASADVAVIKLVGASGLSTVKTNSTLPATGAKVTAVGDANGTTDHLTQSPGTVTATGRTITTSSDGSASGETLHDLIQIAAGVVGGDSGGAVYDSNQAVVGMTTAASTNAATGYAIPIRTALTVARDLENHVTDSDYAYGRPAFLGVALSARGNAASTTIAKVYANTPASRAGLVAGDVITRVDGTATATGAALQKAIRAHSPGDSVKLSWTANGSTHSATLTLTEGPVA